MSKTNELLTQEITKLRAEGAWRNLRCQLQETELQKSGKKAQELVAAEQSTKLSAAKEAQEAINSLIAQIISNPKLPNVELVKQSSCGKRLNFCMFCFMSTQLKDVAEKLPSSTNGQNGFHFPQENQKTLEPSSLESPEWIEQYDPGVYITLRTFHDGTRDLRRVRFSRKEFKVHQAETWWLENRNKVYEKYNVRF